MTFLGMTLSVSMRHKKVC